MGELLGKVGELDDAAMTEVVRLYGEGLAKPDELTLARIEREREEASQRLAKTRDIAAWQATMARLDAEQQVARQPRQQQRMAPDEVVAYLRSLPTLWADAGPEGRQALASALFTKLEVEGYTKMRYAAHTRCRYPRSRRSPTGADWRPVVTQVGLVGARGVAPAWPTCGSGRNSCSRTSTPAARSWPAAYRKAG